MEDKEEAHKLKRRATHYLLQDDVLYKRDFSSSLLRCTGGKEANYVLLEIHEGVCGNHTVGLTLAHKVPRQRQGYYWPTLKNDATICEKVRQVLALLHHLKATISRADCIIQPLTFRQVGIDLIGSFPKGKESASYAIVAIDYFTKCSRLNIWQKSMGPTPLSSFGGISSFGSKFPIWFWTMIDSLITKKSGFYAKSWGLESTSHSPSHIGEWLGRGS